MPEPMEGGFQSLEETQVCGLKVSKFLLQMCTQLLPKKLEIFNITVFQFLGMVLFSYVVIAYNGIITYPGIWVVLVGMFFSLVFSGSFGCGYLNPALTFACMIRKQGRIHPIIGLYYVFIQYVGAFVGTFIAWSYDDSLIAPFPVVHSTLEPAWKTFGREIFGSFFFIFCVLIIISSGTTFTKNNFQTWMCVPLCLLGVCKIFGLGLGTNPAQALAFQVAFYVFSPVPHEIRTESLQKIWSVVVGASFGGVVATVVYQFVFRLYVSNFREELIYDEEGREQIRRVMMNRGLEESMLRQSQRQSQSGGRRVTDIQIV